MRRLIPFLALAIVLTGCAGSDDDAAPTTTESPATTTSAPTTTQPPETTVAATTPETTSPAGNDATAAFEPIPATPPAVFDSFTSSLVISMGFDDTAIEVNSEGS